MKARPRRGRGTDSPAERAGRGRARRGPRWTARASGPSPRIVVTRLTTSTPARKPTAPIDSTSPVLARFMKCSILRAKIVRTAPTMFVPRLLVAGCAGYHPEVLVAEHHLDALLHLTEKIRLPGLRHSSAFGFSSFLTESSATAETKYPIASAATVNAPPMAW